MCGSSPSCSRGLFRDEQWSFAVVCPASQCAVLALVAVLPQVSVWDNAALLCALLLLPERARIRSTVPRGQ